MAAAGANRSQAHLDQLAEVGAGDISEADQGLAEHGPLRVSHKGSQAGSPSVAGAGLHAVLQVKVGNQWNHWCCVLSCIGNLASQAGVLTVTWLHIRECAAEVPCSRLP